MITAADLNTLTPAQQEWLSGQLQTTPSEETTELIAYVEADADEPTLRRALSEQLPAYMVPARIVPMKNWPRLPNGKLDVERLQQQNRTTPQTAQTNNPLEQRLLTIWRRILNRPELEPHHNFFEWGGHSIQVIQIIDELKPITGRLSVADFFQRPTVRELAAWIKPEETVTETPSTLEHVFPLQREGRGRPVFAIQPDMFSEVLADWFRDRRPVYGVRGVGFRHDLNAGRWPTLNDLVQEIFNEMKHVQPTGPYVLAGFSFGGVIAFELARHLAAIGESVERLVLFEPTPWNVYRKGPIVFQLRNSADPMTSLSPARALGLWLKENVPFKPDLYRRAGRTFFVTPGRTLLQRRAQQLIQQGKTPSPFLLRADARRERFRLYFNYQPTPIGADTVLFKSAQARQDNGRLWRPYFEGSFEDVELPGDHFHMLASDEGREIIRTALLKSLI
ncbi:MAG: alpha/beta fold hydrolase [Verrucomicrobiota bacterium]